MSTTPTVAVVPLARGTRAIPPGAVLTIGGHTQPIPPGHGWERIVEAIRQLGYRPAGQWGDVRWYQRGNLIVDVTPTTNGEEAR
jgi:hypothetical protein